MFDFHHREYGFIFSFFHPLEKAKKEFQLCHYSETSRILQYFYGLFGNLKSHPDFFRKTDDKPFNDKQLELIGLGISRSNADFPLITRHHVNAVLGLLKQGKNIDFVNTIFSTMQSAKWNQLDLISLGLDHTSSFEVEKIADYNSIVKKFDDGFGIKEAFESILYPALNYSTANNS